jgi:putative flippase GtrA
VRLAGMQTSVSYIAKIVASVLINYVARKKFVFKG